uniref:Testis derived transcript (3 LIM domains) n=1 Tax=Poecilia reticulata TaxID=8081 RepID=A0A3P9N377_POERE
PDLEMQLNNLLYSACLKCKDKCEGFELHFWRKICRNCKCGLTEHDVSMNSEENKKVGKLFEDTKYTGLIAKLKTDGIPGYQGNMVTITLPSPTTAYTVPPMAVRYIELLPPEKRPVAGTQGAAYRRQQMDRQLPEHDQDPSKCHELSPAEVKQMQQYIRKCKDEALGVGDVLLPEEVAQIQAGGAGATVAGSGGTPGRSCHHCKKPMLLGEPAVYAERAGYDKLWHPACFVCCTCSELLVDMIYFWKKGKMFCGRHYGDSEKPRCGGCDELIFSNEYTQAEGQNWHLKHFCCFDCDCILAGETYVMENDKPICKPCYMKNYAVKCASCQKAVEPEAQRVSYGEHHWHAEPDCFKCSGCTKCLIGQRFMAVKNCLFCSVECKKKVMA